jgi:16S rRNA (guanine1207-N2)-methyltransferase
MERRAWVDIIRSKIRPPLAIALGSPREVAALLVDLAINEASCYQMDLYQADRLNAELGQGKIAAHVVVSPDLWDLTPDFQTILYPTPLGGERSLKIDLVEQAFHVLRPRGMLIVLSPYERDQLFPGLLKKVFGAVHATSAGNGTVFWCPREADRSRRRHEVTFQARVGDGPSLRFLSRPGVFSYGRFDAGARALVETMQIDIGDRILDLGCGCGTNGIVAGRFSGPNGHVTLVDSNLRAVVLARHNARANGLVNFQVIGSSLASPALGASLDETRTRSASEESLPSEEGSSPNYSRKDSVLSSEGPFDVVLANPPYYAQGTIAQLFIARALPLLRPGGRFYLVTKQPDQIGPLMAAAFGRTDVIERRGYIVLSATGPRQ